MYSLAFVLMKISIVIPAKGSSDRVANKNLFKINGKSLVRRACEKVLKCNSLTKKYLDTEDEGIKLDCMPLIHQGLSIIDRPKELATDTSSDVGFLKHFFK